MRGSAEGLEVRAQVSRSLAKASVGGESLLGRTGWCRVVSKPSQGASSWRLRGAYRMAHAAERGVPPTTRSGLLPSHLVDPPGMSKISRL